MVASKPPQTEIVLYKTEDGQTRIECRFEDESLWLTQAMISDLYQVSVSTANEHIQNIFREGELREKATIRKFRIVRKEGSRSVTREIDHYNLPAILAVGYRVRSARGTQFRQWATARLSEYLVKGFILDDERLKNPSGPGVTDYFDELLERIRDIRASEKRMYLRLRDVLALAADYRASEKDSQKFFQIVQNKLHYAVTGQTAPELIASRANGTKANMGLSTWSGGVVRKKDVAIAKNYLQESEISALNRIVSMFLDYAEDQTERHKQIYLADWKVKLDSFLHFNQRDVLKGAGRISREEAEAKAELEFEKFSARRRFLAESQGEKALQALENKARMIKNRTKHIQKTKGG